jgi:hypothetical protein
MRYSVGERVQVTADGEIVLASDALCVVRLEDGTLIAIHPDLLFSLEPDLEEHIDESEKRR